MENVKNLLAGVSQGEVEGKLKVILLGMGKGSGLWTILVDEVTLKVEFQSVDIVITPDTLGVLKLIEPIIDELNDSQLAVKPAFGYHENGLEWAPSRICDVCGKRMAEGYCIDAGAEHYCSDECLHQVYTEEEYNEMYGDGEGDTYWTEWED